MSTTSAPKYENSLQTAVRWGWNLLVAYSAFRIVFDIFFPRKVEVVIPTMRSVLRGNAEHMRQAGMCFAAYRKALVDLEGDVKQARAEIKARGLHPEDMDVEDTKALDSYAYVHDSNARRRQAAEKVREHAAAMSFPTRQQQQRISRMLAVLDQHDAAEEAKDEADERADQIEQDMDFRRLYDHAVKHGHIDPTKVTFKHWQHARWRVENPSQVTVRFKVVSAVIIALVYIALYNLTH